LGGNSSRLRTSQKTPDAEKLFDTSFNRALQDYQRLLRDSENRTKFVLVNDNFDTGTRAGPGEYPLADKTYARLLDRLAKDHFVQVSPKLRSDLLTYYSDLNAPYSTKQKTKQWEVVLHEVNDLKTADFAQQ
jgi:hypothetical protein